MVVITGAQRSGTSFMAKFVHECGYDLGTDFWDSRIDGGYENPDVCNFYRNFVGSDIFPFVTYWKMINQSQFKPFESLDTPVVKFSYLCMLPQFVTKWFFSRLGKKDKFIIMVRDVTKIVQSKESRKEVFDKEDWYLLDQTAGELQRNRQKSLRLMHLFSMEYMLVPFPFTSDLIPEIVEFTGLTKLSEKIFIDLFDSNKIHF